MDLYFCVDSDSLKASSLDLKVRFIDKMHFSVESKVVKLCLLFERKSEQPKNAPSNPIMLEMLINNEFCNFMK